MNDDLIEIENHLGEKYERFAHRNFFILTVLILLFISTTVTTAYLIRENRQRSQDIQNQRINTIRNTCRTQNIRNRNTVKVLNKRINQLKNDKTISITRKRQLETSRLFSVLLINALAPKQNCRILVEKFTGGK